MRIALAVLFAVSALVGAERAEAYSWPVKPFHHAHAIRGGFDDPRYHLGEEGELSAFHSGVDIAVPDGTPVFAVEPGYVSRHPTLVSVHRPNGREFGYWHIRPVVHTGQHVRIHQLLGYVIPGWGHVHFSERDFGAYKNPLRRGALTPYPDRTRPTVASIELLSLYGEPLDPGQVTGVIDVAAVVYDTPPIEPAPPWQTARVTPAEIFWKLYRGSDAMTRWTKVVSFYSLLPDSAYDWIYAPGTYQNKANRPGNYNFWLAHGFDTTSFLDGSYRLAVVAEDTRGNVGTATLDFVLANGGEAPLDPEPPPSPFVRRPA